LESAGYREGWFRVKLLHPDSGRWEWTNLPVAGRREVTVLLEGSEAEKARQVQARRQATEAARREGRVSGNGKAIFTDAEREDLRPTLGVAVAASPTLVVRSGRVGLHLPFQTAVEVVPAEAGRQAGLHRRVLTVDTNTHNVTCAAWDGDRLIEVRKLSFSAVVAAREKAVGKAIAKAAQSRHRSRGQRHGATLWDHIANQGETCARQAASWICAMAAEHGCTVVIFEHLRTYRPQRGTRSARSNRRRSYWLRGRIRRYSAQKAIAQSILTVERNPAWTSRCCPRCGSLGERFSASRKNPAHQARFVCPGCGWQGDAEVVAAFNLKKKWDRSFRYPTKTERQQWKQTSSTKTVSRGTAARPANPKLGDAGLARCPEPAPNPGVHPPRRLVSDGSLMVGLC
jgi:predicted RNA-binding Zn-ribbon protein involved in translation (DUF1610 family)